MLPPGPAAPARARTRGLVESASAELGEAAEREDGSVKRGRAALMPSSGTGSLG